MNKIRPYLCVELDFSLKEDRGQALPTLMPIRLGSNLNLTSQIKPDPKQFYLLSDSADVIFKFLIFS